MSTDKNPKSALKKDKKSKRKSTGNTPLPPPDTVIESYAPVEAKADIVQPKKQKKEKSKGEAVKEAEKAEEPTPTTSSMSAPLPVSTDKKTKTKGKATNEAEKPEDSAPNPPAAVSAEKQKKKKTKSEASENVDGPTKPAINTPLSPVPKSISATSKASAPSKIPKTFNKPSQKPKKVEQKEPSPSPSASSVPEAEKAEEAAADDSEQDGDEDIHLHGFSTDDDDSSDEDDNMDYEAPALDISKLPTIAKDDATVKRRLEKAKRQPTEDRGVVYIGRVPHGFYEDQMRGYFSQFGNVTRTGRSKHYGFIEFDSSSVAQIVAETMDNYLLTGHILRCKVISKDEVPPELWIGANRKWRVVPRHHLTRVQHNKTRTEDERARTAKRIIKRQNERKRKLAEAGINYDFSAASYKKLKEV
ncbi:hypothetical protein C0995_008218 [Termitomyces sp. Mi166|nr:hypothetical protein C0995_008218 [Termitomyces sp. Mi166\